MLIPNCSANNCPDEEERESGQTKLRMMKSFYTQTRSKSERDQIDVQESFSIISQTQVGFVEFQQIPVSTSVLGLSGTGRNHRDSWTHREIQSAAIKAARQ